VIIGKLERVHWSFNVWRNSSNNMYIAIYFFNTACI